MYDVCRRLSPQPTTKVYAYVYAYNVDLFVEHGSTPDGTNPQLTMPAWGDDIIAYIFNVNK